jgi:ATPase family associated with various cellular activities (AAA)
MPVCYQDRGISLSRAAAVAEATRRCLALHGHVDDLLPTSAGCALRLPEFLAIDSSRTGTTTVIVSETEGISTLTPPGRQPPAQPVTAPPGPLGELLDRAIEQLQGSVRPTMIVLRHAHSAAESNESFGEQLRDLPFDRRLRDGLRVIAIFREPTAPAVLDDATGWEVHYIALPGRAERRAALGYWERIGVADAATLDLDELAAVTGGLELDDIRRLAAEHTGYEPLTPRRISAVRSAALARQLGDLVKVDHHPAISFDDVIGGHAVKALVGQARNEGRYSPIGLFGPPGVGKTMLATAAARELGVPIAYVDGRLKGGIVGETARNLARFREMLIAYSPVVVFWDEIDLLLGRSTDYNGDSGASNEVRQASLTLIQDAASLGIFVIASGNNPLSAMQYRIRNRLRLIPVLHPTADEALEIAHREAAKLGVTLASDAGRVFEAGHGVLWNGRGIAQILAAARSNVLLARGPVVIASESVVIGAEDLWLLVRYLASGRDEAAELNALEAIYVVDNPYDLPWIARRMAGQTPAPLPAYLSDVVGADGLPDRQRIAARLAAAGVQDAR